MLNKAYSVTVKAEELLGPGAMGDDDTLHVKHSSVSQEEAVKMCDIGEIPSLTKGEKSSPELCEPCRKQVRKGGSWFPSLLSNPS